MGMKERKMIEQAVIEKSKGMIEVIADLMPGDIYFAIIEGDTITWEKKSKGFTYEIFHVGQKLSAESTTLLAMREKRTLTKNVPRSFYGARLKIVSIPTVDEDNTVVGAFSVVTPIVHPVIEAFKHFAPVLVEMFSEGAFLYATDLTNFIETKSSKKFAIDSYPVGRELTQGDIAYKTVQTRQPQFGESPKERFGVPVAIACFPLFSIDNEQEIVGTLGIVLPKKTAAVLREMSVALESGLTDISSAIEQLAASAIEINANEESLNESIKDVIQITNEINDISAFIKDIAEETKLLGLNASIEAARAGEFGKGFGVVADEIRKLSSESKSTVPKMNSLTDTIRQKVEQAGTKSKASLDSSQEQASATEEITSSIEEITSMAAQLGQLANEL